MVFAWRILLNTWKPLYALLLKRFKNKVVWTTDAMKLAETIHLTEKYPSLVVRKTETAVRQINKQNLLKISLEVDRPRNGKAVLTFTHKKD